MAYVVTHCFLQRIWERKKYDDLVVLLDGMCLSFDGERSMDPALVDDWAKATASKVSFTKREGFDAARTFLRYWDEIGPGEEIKSIIHSMETSRGGEPVRQEIAELWNSCWDEVSANLDAGDPFKTSFCYGINEQGKTGRLQRNAKTGFHEFVED